MSKAKNALPRKVGSEAAAKNAVGTGEMKNTKKKLETSHSPQTKVPSVCVPSEERNALPKKSGSQVSREKPSETIVFHVRALTCFFSEEEA